MTMILFRISMSLGLMLLAGCQGEKLSKLVKNDFYLKGVPAPLSADFCSLNSEKVKPDLRILFLVDDSESAGGVNDSQNQRFQRIKSLINDVASDQGTSEKDDTVFFSLVAFDQSPRLITWYGSEDSDPFGRSIDSIEGRIKSFSDALDKYLDPNMPKTPGATSNFSAAFNQARLMIQADLDLASKAEQVELAKPAAQRKEIQSSVYVILLMSDGVPSVLLQDGNLKEGIALLPELKQTLLEKTLGSIAATDTRSNRFVESFMFNSVFYNTQVGCDPANEAQQIMQQLVSSVNVKFARPGWIPGKFYCSKEDLNYQNFAYPERIARFDVKNVMVENLNLIWSGGSFVHDSDGDGLSDQEEARIGTSPSVKDTNADGVSDFIAYDVFKTTCDQQNSDCLAIGPTNFHSNLCRGLFDSTLYESSGALSYYDSDNDGLNDCEEALMQTSPFSFHSGYSWLLDSSIKRSGQNPKEMNVSKMLSDPESTGKSLWERIRVGLPVFQSSDSRGMPGLSYRLDVTSEGAKQSCYHVEVDNLQRWAPEDQIRFTVMESTLSRRKDWSRSVTKAAGDSSIRFSVADFPEK